MNPYAPPTMPQPMAYAQQPGYQGGVWRQGNALVMHKMAHLPPICVKSGQPSTVWLKRNLSWHHPLCYLGLIGGLIPFVVIALIMTKKASIQVGLTEEWAAKRRSWMAIAWGTALLGLLVLIGSIAILANTEQGIFGFGIVAGIAMMLTGAILGIVNCSIVRPKKIDDTYVWLNGVNREVLAMFPELPAK